MYSVRFQLQGFATVIREGITLTPGFTSSLNIALEVASVAETVTVVGESPIIDVTNAVVASNFNKELTQCCPTGHDVFSVLAVTPGVQLTAPDVGGSRAGLRAQFRVFGSTSQWNVIEGAIMASLQYEDPDVYEEVQVAGASKGADAPVGGSFNNFIVKSGGNNVHGLFFYDREPLDLQSSNLSPELEAQGVSNTSSVARYQSVHADIGGPIMRDRFWWFYAFRNLNSDNWTPGYYNTDTGLPEPVFTTLRNHVTKLNFRLNASHTLSYSAQYNSKSLPNSGASAFVDSASTSLTDFPYWIQGAGLTSILSNRSTLEVKWGEFGWRWWTRPGADEIARMDLDTQLVRGRRNAPFIDRSHHMNLSGVYSLTTSGDRAGDHNLRAGYGYLYEGAPYFFLAPKDSIRTFWRGGFATPAEIETYDTPFSFENDVIAPVGLHQRYVEPRPRLTQRRRTARLVQAVLRGAGQSGNGPISGRSDLPRIRVPPVERLRASRVRCVRHVRHRTNGTQACLRPLLLQRRHDDQRQLDDGGLCESDGAHGQALQVGRHAAIRSESCEPALHTGRRQSTLDPDLELPYTDEFVVGLDQQLMSGTAVRFNYVRKLERNRMKLQNTAIPFAAYNIPVAFTDRGRDFASTADDRVITLYSLDRAYVGPTGGPAHERSAVHRGLLDLQRRGRQTPLGQITAPHRIRCQPLRHVGLCIGHLAGHRHRHRRLGVPQDPNRLTYNNRQDYWHWQYKFLGSYELPWRISTSASIRIPRANRTGAR